MLVLNGEANARATRNASIDVSIDVSTLYKTGIGLYM